MRMSERTESFPSRSGLMSRMAGYDSGDGSGLRHACACRVPRGGGCQRKRFPGGFGKALEVFGVDRVVFDTLDRFDPHGARR